jgi:hypothetical protein
MMTTLARYLLRHLRAVDPKVLAALKAELHNFNAKRMAWGSKRTIRVTRVKQPGVYVTELSADEVNGHDRE